MDHDELWTKARDAFAAQANAMIKDGTPFQIILSVLADITRHMAIKIEKSGDIIAALKRLQGQRFADMAKQPDQGWRYPLSAPRCRSPLAGYAALAPWLAEKGRPRSALQMVASPQP